MKCPKCGKAMILYSQTDKQFVYTCSNKACKAIISIPRD